MQLGFLISSRYSNRVVRYLRVYGPFEFVYEMARQTAVKYSQTDHSGTFCKHSRASALPAANNSDSLRLSAILAIISAYRCVRLCLVRIFSYARTSRKVRFMQTEKSSYDESSKTCSTTKSSGGNWTNGSVRGGVHEVTHHCETISHNTRFFL